MISKDVLDLIQGSLYFSKKKGRALYNIKPKDYGNNPQRKRRTPEIDEFEGESYEISAFNKDREIKRSKHVDIDQTNSLTTTFNNRPNPFTNSNSFKKNYRPASLKDLKER